ncbi:family 43 glycosylhydrolase [Tundrisphaera lichenicola]|uniref:family 43 glycosylhydrolase n=1 Tax=Tundrisphaera lichenicola TaxID=2029860 RepID=UPI003EC0C23B
MNPRRFALNAILLLTSGIGSARADQPGGAEVRDFYNVLAPDGADPWVFRAEDGFYYASTSTGGSISILRSRTLSGLGGGERKVAWTPPAQGPTSKELWAPELHQLDGKWYIYVAADDGENANHRMYALENPSKDPFEGEFTLKAKVFDPAEDRWAIDGTAFRAGGRLYFVWSGWEGFENVAQNLYIAPMENPWTLAGPRVLISKPDLPWERRGGPPSINEGPEALIKGDTIHIVYSAAGSWTDHYCLGLFTSRLDRDLLDPRSWTKRETPAFESGNGVLAPGHGSFTRSPDGREDWLVYHAARYPGAGWTRLVRAQPFTWSPDGTPLFGQPPSPDQPIPIPGGEPPRRRFEAEDAQLAGTARVARQPNASGGAKVGHIDTPESSVTFTISAPRAGDYLLSIRSGNGSDGRALATHSLTVNDAPPQIVRHENAGWDRWSNAFVTVRLKSGENRLRFARGTNFAEIDCVDLFEGDDLRGH